MKYLIGVVCAFLLTASTLTLAQDATPDTQDAEAVSVLFVQTTSGGFLSTNEDGTFTLVLEDISPTLWFTDRPQRKAGHIPTADFIRAWADGADSFEADPPNAVLEIGQNDHVIELMNAVYDEAANSLTYTVRPLTDEQVDVTVGDHAPLTSLTFETAALFIDDALTSEQAAIFEARLRTYGLSPD